MIKEELILQVLAVVLVALLVEIQIPVLEAEEVLFIRNVSIVMVREDALLVMGKELNLFHIQGTMTLVPDVTALVNAEYVMELVDYNQDVLTEDRLFK